jgi:hypothetical protein
MASAARILALLFPLLLPAQGLAPELQRRADRALKAPPPTVMEKTLMPEGWDLHAYSSPARYYWPDPAKADGLPWIARDGYPNRAAIDRSDEPRLARMIGDVEALVAAWGATARPEYAARAALYLRAWFLDPATRMTPDFRGAQFVAGKDRGRGSGLIDFAQLHRLLDACRALEAWPDWPAAERADLKAWMTAYLGWLDTDKGAAKEAKAKNNHGTWFAVQRSALLLYLGRHEEARAYLERAAPVLAAGQFEADGRQPLETARVDGLSYSLYNLQAWYRLAAQARLCGARIELSAVRRAAAYVRPFLEHPEAWPWSQKDPLPRGAGDFLEGDP